MTEDARRRYLLGLASEDERAQIEREYFEQADAIDRMGDAEDELIEDYLEDRLLAEEREPFEREYLASSVHRTRVETVRRLKRRAQDVSRRRKPSAWWLRPESLAAAAAALIVLVVVFWTLGRQKPPASTTAERAAPATPAVQQPSPAGRSEPQRPPGRAPRVFAVELPALAFRGSGQAPPVTIPAGTDLVDLRFEPQPGTPSPALGTVVITTVDGAETWRGRLATGVDHPHVLVPAPALASNDYIVNAAGVGRYFLRVR